MNQNDVGPQYGACGLIQSKSKF